MRLADTLAYLEGGWALSRRIVDHRARLTYAFEGHGDVQTEGRHGHYAEEGVLRRGDQTGTARRALDLIATETGVVAVRFTDGRPFFDLNLTPGRCHAVHPCRSDRYELVFEVASPDLLLERWRVTGPAKDYTAETTWRRQ